MTASRLVIALGLMLVAGCADDHSPLAGGGTDEDARLVAILDADRAGDCVSALGLARGFASTRPERLERVDFVVGRCFYRDRQFAVAAGVLERVTLRPPRSYTGEAIYLAGRSHYRLGAFDAAIARFDEALDCCAGRRTDNALFYRARSHYRLDALLDARADFTALLELPDATPDYRARSLYYIGKTHYRRALADQEPDGFDRALEAYERVLAEHSDASIADDAAYGRGKALYRSDRFDEALGAFEAVLDGFPDGNAAPRARYYLGRTLAALDRHDEALAALRAFEAAHPQHAFADNARYHQGRVLYRAGRYDEAIAVFDAMGEQFPDSFYLVGARYWGARARYAGRDRAAALSLFEELAEGASIYADNARYYAGMCHYHLGVSARDPDRWRAALGSFEQLAADHPASSYRAGAAYFSGRALTRLGQSAEADAAFAGMIEGWPDSSYVDDAWRRRVELALDRGDCAAAQAHFDALVGARPDSPHIDRLSTDLEGAGC